MRGPEMIEGVLFWQNATSMTHEIRFYPLKVTFLGLMMFFRLTFAQNLVFFNFAHFRTNAEAKNCRRSRFSTKYDFNDPP